MAGDAGFDLRTRKADGEQFGFSVAEGRLQGISTASSSVVRRALPIPRTLGNASPRQQILARSGKIGLAVAKPIYARASGDLPSLSRTHEHPAIFTALNADTMEIYTELVPFDAAPAQRMSDRAVKVITATEGGELLPRAVHDSTHFECRMCAWQEPLLSNT